MVSKESKVLKELLACELVLTARRIPLRLAIPYFTYSGKKQLRVLLHEKGVFTELQLTISELPGHRSLPLQNIYLDKFIVLFRI